MIHFHLLVQHRKGFDMKIIKYFLILCLFLIPSISFATAIPDWPNFYEGFEDRTVDVEVNDGTGPLINAGTSFPCQSTYGSTYTRDDITPRYGSQYLSIKQTFGASVGDCGTCDGQALDGYGNKGSRREYVLLIGDELDGNFAGTGVGYGLDDPDSGTEYWIGWSQYIPSDEKAQIQASGGFQINTDNNLSTIMHWGAEDADPNTDGEFRFTRYYGAGSPGAINSGIDWEDYKGQWVDFVLQYRPYTTDTANARLRYYINGVLITGVFDGKANVRSSGATNPYLVWQNYNYWVCGDTTDTNCAQVAEDYYGCDNTGEWEDWSRNYIIDEIRVSEYDGVTEYNGETQDPSDDNYCDVCPTIIPATPTITYPTDSSTVEMVGLSVVYSSYSDERTDVQECFDYEETEVQVDESGGDWSTLVYNTIYPLPTSTPIWANLSDGTSYQVRVRHKNRRQGGNKEANWSAWSTTVTFTTQVTTVYYVDLDAVSSGDGSYASPWNSISDVMDYATSPGFSPSDDIALKGGTSENVSERFYPTWQGTSQNRAVLCAYTGNKIFQLGATARPILSGNNYTYPAHGSYQYIVTISNKDYFEVKDIHITESGEGSLSFSSSDYCLADNILADYCWDGTSVVIGWASNCGIINSEVAFSRMSTTTTIGGGLTISGGNNDEYTYDNFIYNTSVHDCGTEGLDVIQRANNNTVKYCEIYDNWSVNLYLDDACDNNEIAYNLIYSTDEGRWYQDVGISLNSEIAHGTYCCPDESYYNIHDNVLVNLRYGLQFRNEVPGCYYTDADVINNTFIAIDNPKPDTIGYAMQFSGGLGATTDIRVKNNMTAYCEEEVYNCSATGVIFSNNAWDSDPGTGNCDAVDDPANADPEILTKSGFDDIEQNSVTGQEFAYESDSPFLLGASDVGELWAEAIKPDDVDFTDRYVDTVDRNTYGRTYGAYGYIPDEPLAPTPNPATWSTAPTADSVSQISMIATTGSDSTPPISYLFTNDNEGHADAGTGGDSSGWQSADTTYSDTGLQKNQRYGYTVQTRDNDVPTAGTASSVSACYTLAAVPGQPTLSGATSTTLNLTNDANGNPSSTPITYFAIQCVTTIPEDTNFLNKWLDSSGNPQSSEQWLTDAQLDALVIGSGGTALQNGREYGFKVKARNGDSIETALSTEGTGQTTGVPTSPPAVHSIGITYSGCTMQ